MQTNATIPNLYEALSRTNEEYANNLRFKTIGPLNSKRNTFTLTVSDSRARGGRRGFSGKRVAAACWHAHGTFFDHLWEIAPEVTIRAGELVMRGPDDNWQDRNIGSAYQPLFFSEACDCS